MSKKPPKAPKESDSEPEWVPPPYPKPAFVETVWMEGVDEIMAGWVDDSPEGLDARKAKLQEILKATDSQELYKRHFYLEEKKWVEWPTTKHQVLNSYIYMTGLRASRLRTQNAENIKSQETKTDQV